MNILRLFKVALTITNSCHVNAPVFVDTTYESWRAKNTGCNPYTMAEIAIRGSDGLLRLKLGLMANKCPILIN